MASWRINRHLECNKHQSIFSRQVHSKYFIDSIFSLSLIFYNSSLYRFFMDMPQEIEVWYVLPALRRELAIALKENGLSQREVAKKLGITESAVSQYLSNKRGKEFGFPKKILLAIKNSAKKVVKGKNAVDQLYGLSNQIRKEKLLCKIHKNFSTVPRNCKICLKKNM
jgi:uncharacterized protein